MLLPLPTDIVFEWLFFLAFMVVLLCSGDLSRLLRGGFMNLLLIVPLSSIGVPLLLGFPVHMPAELDIPSYILLVIFTLLMANTAVKKIRKLSHNRFAVNMR